MNAWVLIGLTAFAAVFFGGVHVWSRSAVILAVFAFFLLSAATGAAASRAKRKGRVTAPETADSSEPDSIPVSIPTTQPRASVSVPIPAPQPRASLIVDPVSLMGIFFLAWGALSLVPLPASLVSLLSPEAARLWSLAFPPGGADSHTLSLYPFMTRDALLLALAFLLYYWTALYGLGERKGIETVIVGVLVLGTVESLYGLAQLAAGMNTILWWENIYARNFVTGTFINRNHFAAFLTMVICLGIGYLWSVGRGGGKEIRRHRRHVRLRERLMRAVGVFGYRGVLVLLALALMMAALLGSASRGAALSLVCGIVFMLGLILARYFRSRQGFVLMVLPALMLSYVGYVATDRLAERLRTFDAGLADRITLARDGWTMGQDFPVTGSGPGTFEFVFPRYQSVHLEKIVDHAHNDWVELKAEYGWPGLIAVIAALTSFLILTVGRWRSRHDNFVVGVGIGGIGAVVAIAVHSLSDFNLHIPANPLLLALILAVTWRALHSGRQGGEGYQGPAVSLRRSRGWIRAGLLLALAVLAVAACPVIQTWRADAMARTFQNSTVPFRDPAPDKLRTARGLAPGNAAYWLWTAERLRMRPDEKDALLFPAEKPLPDPRLSLAAEGLRRNPTSWQTWREMAWSCFFRESASRKERTADLERALGYIRTAASLRPADNRLRMEKGVIALAAHAENASVASAGEWQKPFSEVIRQNPKMAGVVADLLVLHLGEKGARKLVEFLPEDTESRLGAAAVLLKLNHLEAGMDLIRRGERERGGQVDRLWQEFGQTGAWMDAKKSPEVRKIASLDPDHPGVLLAREESVRAMQAIERRGEKAAKWGDVRVLSSRIQAEMEAKRGDPVRQSYYLGILASEQGDSARAIWWFNRTLNLNSQHFPAWIRLRDLLRVRTGTAAERVQLEMLEKKIDLYSMNGIVHDTWKWMGVRSGKPTWRAVFRVSQPVERAAVRFSGGRGTVWSLDMDGKFLEVWKGPSWEGEVRPACLPGEHEFRLTAWDAKPPDDLRELPFRLEISWR